MRRHEIIVWAPGKEEGSTCQANEGRRILSHSVKRKAGHHRGEWAGANLGGSRVFVRRAVAGKGRVRGAEREQPAG